MNKSLIINNHNQRFRELGHPLFILSLFLLVINDWLLKAEFHNLVTGKLSDFAGLFAFPYFLSVMFPRLKVINHLFTALLFVYWKSPASQPLIDLANSLGFAIGRTIDVTDYVALISVYFSYTTPKSTFTLPLKPIARYVLIAFSSASFIATSLPHGEQRKYMAIDKSYTFPFPKGELISRLNAIQLKEINKLRTNGPTIDFDSEKNIFHFRGHKDTLAILLDYKKVADQDTIKLKTALAEIKVFGDDRQSTLQLISVYKFTQKSRPRDYRKLAIEQFEKRVVKKIRRYRQW